MARISKSQGLTPSERYLKSLCERSFLSLWSYPNLFRNQGGGHELCDLLVVFGDDVIIFSDKSCTFPNTGDLSRDWNRWFKRAVIDSAKQLFGAERWIRQNPNRIFLDQRCTKPFPLDLSNPSRLRFHRIAVALGASERCRDELGGSGSLLLAPSDVGSISDIPFSVGWAIPGKAYVHVLDDISLGILLRELDTITDFTAYLRKKEELINAGRLGFAADEADLLGSYLLTIDGDSHAFPSMHDANIITLDEGFWEDLIKRPEYQAKIERNQRSYLWDGLIETFAKHLQAGTLARGNDQSVQNIERSLRAMASEPRLGRRMLAESLGDLLGSTRSNKTNTRVVFANSKKRAYVFALVSRNGYDDYEQYRDARIGHLISYCHVARHLEPCLEEVIGVALEPAGSNGSSEDLLFLDTREWTLEQAERARKLHEELGILKKPRITHSTDYEFPDSNVAPISIGERRRQRNAKKRERRERAGKQRRK